MYLSSLLPYVSPASDLHSSSHYQKRQDYRPRELYLLFFSILLKRYFLEMKLLFPCYLCPLNLLWFDIQRGHTAIFITHGKCHFHAAISSTYWLCLFKNNNNAQAVGKEHLFFWGMDDDNFKSNWKVHFTISVQSENEVWFAVMKAKMQETLGKNACSCRCRLPACTSAAARHHSDVCNLCAHPEDCWDTAWARQQPWAQSGSSCGSGWPVWGQPGFQADFMLPNWPALF